MRTELRTCPFKRAGDATPHVLRLTFDEKQTDARVVCSCGAVGPRALSTNDAAAYWNARHEDDAFAELQKSVGRIAFDCDQRAEKALNRVDELLANNSELHQRVIEWRNKAESDHVR